MSVASILGEKGRNVVTIQGNASLLDVARSLSTHKIGAVIVSDDGVSVDGIVSERDIVNAIAKNGAEVLLRSVAKFMTQNVITCQDSDTIENLMEKMTKGRFRHLPVVNDGKLDGVISIGDVVKMRIAEAQSVADAMRDYIATG
jgi:CBS domain-containing protein